MSVLARQPTEPLRIWSPPESPFKVEYSSALLREVAISDGFGVLYGIRSAGTIRLLATRGRIGLDPVGVFSCRTRGKVFLTEDDLERFEHSPASVALVMTGETGGFFLRDTTGSIETVRSYQEFSLSGQPVPIEKKRRWPWAAAALALIPLCFFKPHPPELKLTLNEYAGQIQISWDFPTTQTLTIVDGGERTYAPIGPGQQTATYARRTGDVTIGIGTAHLRFLGPPPPLTALQKKIAIVEALESKVTSLRAQRSAGQARIETLERRLQ